VRKALRSFFSWTDAVDHPITDGRDPTEVAQALAGWVISNNMAGVDIDLEDDTAMNNGQFIDWVVSKSERRMRLLFSSMGRTSWARAEPFDPFLSSFSLPGH
jgi:hypothetical protein